MAKALIMAGGVGARTGQEIPKQFLTVFDKPLLVYTLEVFESHPQIDSIYVVSISGWEAFVYSYARQYAITKLRTVVQGGGTVLNSICNGVESIKSICSPDDVVVIHDGVRPLLRHSVLTELIRTCEKFGNAVSSLPCFEHMVFSDDGSISDSYVPKERCRMVLTPQAYKFALLEKNLVQTLEKNPDAGKGSAYVNSLMNDNGVKLHLVPDERSNLKITTADDFKTFKALVSGGFYEK